VFRALEVEHHAAEVCGENLRCALAPPRPDATDIVEDGGCCGAGRDERSIVSALVPALVALLALRRRRSSPRER